MTAGAAFRWVSLLRRREGRHAGNPLPNPRHSPLPSRAGLGSHRAVPYLLVQRSLTPPEIEPVRRAFQATGIFHALDAVHFVKDAFGVLVKGLEESPARQLQGVLANHGVEVDVVADSEWPVLPPAQRIVRAACRTEGFEPLDSLGRPLHVPWDRVVAVSAGWVLREEAGIREAAALRPPSDEVRALLKVGATAWELAEGRIESVLLDALWPTDEDCDPAPSPASGTVSRMERNWRWCADVVLEGGLRFVWQAHAFQFASLGERISRDPAVNFGIFLRGLMAAAPHALLNRGAVAVRDHPSGAGPRYPTLNAFGKETQWLLWRRRQAGHGAPDAEPNPRNVWHRGGVAAP